MHSKMFVARRMSRGKRELRDVAAGCGTPHHGVGIHPTIPVSPTLHGVRDGKDEVLARALEVLNVR